ncbi:amino acid ABC transporter permease [Telmatospirillum siberiense]|uniref:Amino acid ABC transporter permease n=2 Tax=Telmatospirillum siberiense TaxID=382514 RepID=A0A2N3Q1M7_9PROT|nr:amino acid ABC transporter permease [Telmatospirillum siberiense]PKU26491.1 amino acid ABC transporter permease [Telmatospirillum siberiense]
MVDPVSSGASSAEFRHWWNNERFRGVLYQFLLMAMVAGIGWFLVANTLTNLNARHIATGFGFLDREAGFGISEHLVPYLPSDSYFRAFEVGLLNTLEVAVIGIVLTTLLGLVMGIARLSHNWLVARLASAYVEAMRNVPVLLLLLFCYSLITVSLPLSRNAFNLFDCIFLSNRGLRVPAMIWDDSAVMVVSTLALAVAASFLVGVWARRRQEKTGRYFPVLWSSLGLIAGLPLIAFLATGAHLSFDVPHMAGFNFAGGSTVSPEFAALLLGLVVYTGAFIAEIVRSGILAVSYGQTEAALALGLSRMQVLRLVVLPQSLRVIIPPLTSQYLNLVKNSPLAVAIGFPDLVSVANTAINQTGQAVEGVSIIMGVYLAISLILSFLMNWYNKRVALRGGR